MSEQTPKQPVQDQSKPTEQKQKQQQSKPDPKQNAQPQLFKENYDRKKSKWHVANETPRGSYNEPESERKWQG